MQAAASTLPPHRKTPVTNTKPNALSRILIITPKNLSAHSGNRVTARRWATMLRSFEHQVQVVEAFHNQRCDRVIALHARRNAASIAAVRQDFPEIRIIVVLTGTDLYRDIHRSAAARRSLDLADRLVVLQERGPVEVPRQWRSKVRVIYQSAEPPQQTPKPLRGVFEVCVSGHLRSVKDPFRAELASRRLPADSAIRITHIGAALSEQLRSRADAANQKNPRYRWLGEQPRWKASRILARSRVLVLSSKIEGGANVICEAVVAGVPVLASRISGTIGMLGEDYGGYFSPGNTNQLTQLLQRFESDTGFRQQLQQQCQVRSVLFAPAHERAALTTLVAELCEA